MKLILFIATLSCVSCKKETEKTPFAKPVVNVTAAVTQDTVVTSSGTFKYWKSIATVDRALLDTSYVIIQWDAYSVPGSYELTMRDTVVLLPFQSGSVSHRSRIIYMHPWFAKEVKVSAAWDKHKKHDFKW